jgi:hypothetical protein
LKRFLYSILALIFYFGCTYSEKSKEPWKPIFNGKNLDGWKILGGKAKYKIKDNTIVGASTLNTPNTFLTTEEIYSNFILELEFKVDPLLNSGIQIRSNSIPEYYNGRVHGYQIEIDPSERAWSAGIYDESRRGWLNPLTENPSAQKAFKKNAWNKYRIEAIGDTIKTWINDVEAAHLIDDVTSSGFIGLQVHGIGRDTLREGATVIWKNIQIITEDVVKYSKPSSLKPIITKNNLTISEVNDGWQMLWDGKTMNGFQSVNPNKMFDGWTIENGELNIGLAEVGHDIITIGAYDDFELKFDFKLTQGANSGVKYYVNQFEEANNSFLGLEFQVVDDANHPDALEGDPSGCRTAGALYDILMPKDRKYLQPLGEWNRAQIISKNNKVTHWLNNIKVLEYQRNGNDFKTAIENSKFKDIKNFGLSQSGHILFQEHGSNVSYRNIKIKESVTE